MEQFVFFTDDPNYVAGLEGGVRGRVHDGGAVAFDADDETGCFITDAGFLDGASHEWFSPNSRKTLISLSVAATMM